MNALTSPDITELTTEDAPLNLLGEWLRSWFNGSLHAVGAHDPVLFPAVNFAFGQSPQVQPLYLFGQDQDTTIRLVMIPRTETTVSEDTILYSGKLATARVLFNFYITSKHPGPGMAQQSAQTVANLLKAILTNPDSRFPLALKGIEGFACEPIRNITSVDYAQRIVACSAQLLYPILFGCQPLPLNGALVSITAAQPAVGYFLSPQELIVGEYLMGTFTAASAVTLASAKVTAYAPQVSAVVLELEVSGTLTGQQLTIPVGAVNVEVTATVDLSAITLTAGQVCKWKVISAPGTLDTGWRAFVEMSGLVAVVPTAATLQIAAWPQAIEFFQPNALVQGDYLLGSFTAACNLNLSAVTLKADTASSSPIVLQLEINGGLTSTQLVLAALGTTLTQALAVTVTTGQVLRWQVVSAPAPQLSALRVSLSLTATPVV